MASRGRRKERHDAGQIPGHGIVSRMIRRQNQTMQRFTCDCGNMLFFGNSICLRCGGGVGYDPVSREMVRLRPGGLFKVCANGSSYGVCNWVLPARSNDMLCPACRMNRVIPDLGTDRNRMLWAKTEMAKRRLIYTLLRLGITLPSMEEDTATGLAFDILSTVSNPSVTTGHLEGVITVNLEEADDTYRQINRQQLGENSRTLLGHFRHESAHYFWHRFLSSSRWDDPLRLAFRERFGNEWQDYTASLAGYYQHGAPGGWEHEYISAYAASHPWEDWAETWAHYLQIVEGLETCETMGIQVRHLTLPLVILPVASGALPAVLGPATDEDDAFLAWLQRWLCLSTALNEISTSVGESPLYPYVIPMRVAQKLRLAHHFARVWAGQ
jgi:hypothetical protein